MLMRSKVITLIMFSTAAVIWGCAPEPSPVPITPTATELAAPATPTPQAILIDLPAGATQLEYGSEVWRLVCQDCHGDRGQGLTAEWRATWAPADQNCWQSKCHAVTGPPEGFLLPIAPAVAGPGTLARYQTAADLQAYVRAEMPWYRPGTLTEKETWSVTAYLLKLNQIEPLPELDAVTAQGVRLH